MNDASEKIPYVPKPDLEGINAIENDHPLKDAAILLAGFVAIVCIGYALLIGISDWALRHISLQQEMRWFSKTWDSEFLSHPLPDEVQQLVMQLNQQIDFPLQVSVLCSHDINALALPGGRILLTQGLLENLPTNNALIFVLGHEAGHIVHRDHLRGMGRQIIFTMGAALLGFSDSAALSTVNQTIGRAYDREQEARADQYGLQLTQKIYGHTWGAEALFEILAQQENFVDRSLSRFSSTHPPSQDRLNQIRQSQTASPQPLTKPQRPFKESLVELNCD
jgi:Zn-dependent protease with chaperone function